MLVGEIPCPRNLDDCLCISVVKADDGSGTFVCTGLIVDPPVAEDRARHCFKSLTTDTTYDYNETDLADSVAVMGKALSVLLRTKED